MLGEGLARGTLAGERRDGRRLGGGKFGCDLVLGSGGFEVFEFQLHLVDEPRGALRPCPVDLPLELGDLQLLARDGGGIVGVLSERRGGNGLDLISPGALGRESRSQSLNVGSRIHELMESQTALRRAPKVLLSRALRAECVNRVTPVDPVEHVGELRGSDRD